MHNFRVWAPMAERMTLVLRAKGETRPEQRLAMQGPDDRGWWILSADAATGDDYAYLIDDDTIAIPDPRSALQPHGVHGFSQIYDHDGFDWTDANWRGVPLSGAVLYELHIGTFTQQGSFDSAIEQLPYLADLGITHVEVMPIASFSGEFGWGYDGVSLFAVTQNYGGPDAFKRFVDACHMHSLAVVVDVVYNHFGPVGNYAARFGPYLTQVHHTPWGDAINFEAAGSDEVRRFFCDNALMWMRDYHVDGLRLDAVHEFMDRSAKHFMEQLACEVEVLSATVGRRLVLIAESDLNDPRIVLPEEAGGMGIDAQWSDDFHHSLFTVLSKQPAGMGYYDDFGTMADLAKSLKEVFVYDGRYSKYRKRSHGRSASGLSAHHFVVFLQNHDQVGNRAIGDRIDQVIGLPRAKIGLALVLMAPFLPMIFQGEEFAASTPFQYFADHEDETLARAVSEGRKREFAAFGWDADEVPDPDDRATFERSKINWDELHEGVHGEMLTWVRDLIHLRRGTSGLNNGDLHGERVDFNEEKRWLVMSRGAVTLMMNIGEDAVDLPNQDALPIRLSSGPNVRSDGKMVHLPQDAVVILVREQ